MIAQYIFDKIITIPSEGIYNKICLRILMKIRQIYIQYMDPCIEYRLEGSDSIFLPLSHDLPLVLKTHSQYSSNLPRIAAKVKQRYNNMVFIDIGANVGDTVALLRRDEFFPVLCIEGEKTFLTYLEKNVKKLQDVFIESVFVGEESKEVHGEINITGGTANIMQEHNNNQIISIKKLSDILKDYAMFSNAKMIKIDTDGFDCMIIRGSLDFLKVAKPIIFFEYDPFVLREHNDEGVSVFSDLKTIGYEYALIYDNIGNYMISVEIANTLIISEIHNYFLRRYPMDHAYCDICVFHSDDRMFFEEIRNEEVSRF